MSIRLTQSEHPAQLDAVLDRLQSHHTELLVVARDGEVKLNRELLLLASPALHPVLAAAGTDTALSLDWVSAASLQQLQQCLLSAGRLDTEQVEPVLAAARALGVPMQAASIEQDGNSDNAGNPAQQELELPTPVAVKQEPQVIQEEEEEEYAEFQSLEEVKAEAMSVSDDDITMLKTEPEEIDDLLQKTRNEIQRILTLYVILHLCFCHGEISLFAFHA